MLFAHIVDNEVFEVIETEENISELYHRDLVWIEITSVTPTPQMHWKATKKDNSWSFSEP